MDTKDLDTILKEFIGILSEKQREVIEKRYGLHGEKPMTLEAIGQEKGLTRERIRQIEEAALETLKKNLNELSDLIERIKYQLELLGGIRREEQLLEEASALLTPKPVELWTSKAIRERWQNDINFLLDISPYFFYFFEKPDIYSNWYLREEFLKKAINIYKFVEHELKITKRPLPLDQYQLLLRKTMKEFRIHNENILISYLDVSKKFSFNPFGEFGLIDWELINPKNVKAKAKLVLRNANRPMSYQEITKAINELNFDGKRASINTLHNELIANDEFVLVGRGLYALKEWGYRPGTTKDIIISILAKKPMTYREVLEEVKKQRLVKDTTVLINLQDKTTFKKLPDRRYCLIQSANKKN